MKVGILISIRNKSNRFPNKVLQIINGQTVTEILIDRLILLTKGYDKLVIATSDDKRDQVFKKISVNKNVEIYFGDKNDKLKRYLQIVNYYNFDGVIIVDGDDILCFPELINETIYFLRQNIADVIFWRNIPVGAACSGLKKEALEKVMEIKDETDTEVWGGYFTEKYFRIRYAEPLNELFKHPEIRLTLDYFEDYKFLLAVFNEFKSKGINFSSNELMSLLIEKKPEINLINKAAQKKYEENLKKSKPIKFKNDTN